MKKLVFSRLKKFSFAYIFVIFVFATFVLLGLYLVELKYSKSLLEKNESLQTKVDEYLYNEILNRELDPRICSEKEMKENMSDNFNIESIEIISTKLPSEEQDLDLFSYKIIVEFNPSQNENSNQTEGCEYDITELILKGLNIKNEDLYVLSDMLYFPKGTIAYKYNNAIYTQNVLKGEKPKKIFSDSIIKGTLLSKTGTGYEVIGPYLADGGRKGVATYTYFIFFADVTWGCEGQSQYCDSMLKATAELSKKNLLGMFKYDVLTGKRTFIYGLN